MKKYLITIFISFFIGYYDYEFILNLLLPKEEIQMTSKKIIKNQKLKPKILFPKKNCNDF